MFGVSALFWFFHMNDCNVLISSPILLNSTVTTLTQIEPLAFTANGVLWVCAFVHLLNRDPGIIKKNTATPEVCTRVCISVVIF